MADGHWQLDGAAAELYECYLVPAITVKWAKDLLDRARPREGEAILDLACGTGIVARVAASMMGQGPITGLDLNSAMLAVARSAPIARRNRASRSSWRCRRRCSAFVGGIGSGGRAAAAVWSTIAFATRANAPRYAR